MSFTPTIPSTTTTTTTTTTMTAGPLLPEPAVANDLAGNQRSDGLSDSLLWGDSSSFPSNPLDLWFEQAVSGATASNQGSSPPAASATNAATMSDVFATSDPFSSFDLKNDQDFPSTVNSGTDIPASLILPPVYPTNIGVQNPSSALDADTDHIPSRSGLTSIAAVESSALTIPNTPVANSGAVSTLPPTTSASFDTSVSPVVPASLKTAGASSSAAKPIRTAQTSIETRLESPILSHTDLHPLSTSDGASAPTATSPDPDDMTPFSLFESQSAANDGLSAVERAKRSAEQFTVQQLAKRRRKTSSPSAGNSASDNDGGDDVTGDQQSHRKYQKRLQKNRDSAFVSRIRRREYTRILEQSLSAVEKEKETALAAFREMKRRFDIVSAELTGIKTAAASNFVNLGDAMINRVAMPQSPAFPFASTQHPSQQQVPLSAYGKQAQSQNGFMGLQQSRPVPALAHTGTVMTTMYMIALVVGVLLPDLTRRPAGSDKLLPREAPRGSELQTTLQKPSSFNLPGTSGHGHVWGTQSKSGHFSSEEFLLGTDVSNGAADRLVDTVNDDAVSRLGQEIAERALDTARRYLQMLTPNQIANIENSIRNDQTYQGFEALLRAIILDDGGDAGKGLDLDDIVFQVAGLSFEDRV